LPKEITPINLFITFSLSENMEENSCFFEKYRASGGNETFYQNDRLSRWQSF